jgi:hypothetical protein
MTHEVDTSRDGDLTAFFDAARQEGETPSGDFIARLEMDALRLQPVPEAQRRPAPKAWRQPASKAQRRGAFWSDLLRALGGWPAVAGMTAAGCAGLWIGMSPPDPLLSLFQDQAVVQTLDPLSGYDYAMLER